MNRLRRKFGKRMKYNYKRTFFGLFLFLLILGIGIGYATLNTNLSIDGTSHVTSARWNIYFDNLIVDGDSAPATAEAAITDSTTVNFGLTLEEPGDFYEFTVDIVNDGTLNAKVADYEFLPLLTQEQKQYFDYTIKYTSGSEINIGDALNAGTTETIIVRVEYKELEDASLYPLEDVPLNLSITIEYEQGDGNPPEILVGPTFKEDPIVENIKMVTVDFRVSCGSGYECSYIINDGEVVPVNTRKVYIPFDSTGVIYTTTTNQTNTINNSYNVKYNKVYVKSDGNDSSGYGTIAKPYQSIPRAYQMTEDTSTIYVMDDITASATTEIDNGKKIFITSCNKVDDTSCPEVSPGNENTISRDSNLANSLFDIFGGDITFDGIVINGNNKESNMAMINNFAGDVSVYPNTTLTGGNNSQGGGAIYAEGGHMSMTGGTITNNYARAGGGVFIKSSSIMYFDGGTILNNNSDTGAGIFVDDARLDIRGGYISSNSANAGGALYGTNYSSININGGQINGNTSNNGGGAIFLYNGSKLIINNGSIDYNTANEYGGAVFLDKDSELTLNNGSINNNNSVAGGGGIYTNRNTKIELKGGTISNNRVSGNITGGGAISNAGIVNIKGTTISGNVAEGHNGGAIWSRGGTITMTSGTISNNTANSGGGIMLTGYEENSIKLIISGGTISNNTATTSNGGGIMLLKYTDFLAPILTMSGTAIVSGNTSANYGGGICSTGAIINMNGGSVKKNTALHNGGISSSGTYNYTSGYICQNNNPTNSFDVTPSNNANCS